MMERKACLLETLTLKNLNCFAELSLSFHERLTVLVAPNGGGKTTVLDAAAVALESFVGTMEGRSGPRGFDARSIHREQSPSGTMEPITPVRVDAQGRFFGSEIKWARELRSEQASRTTMAEARTLSDFARGLLQQNQRWVERKSPDAPLFPLIAYYGTGRLWSPGSMNRRRATDVLSPNARYRGYTDCLSPSSHYRTFVDWFRRYSYESKNEGSPHEPARVLGAVSRAVDIALKPSGWGRLEWDFAEQTIVACHGAFGRLPVDVLSDGIRSMIGLVADIAHRAIRLNPHLRGEAPIDTPGIVLIDEVDMHLHPEWQQVVLSTLREAFPRVQFIVTTHSPQVLTTIRKENIHILACDEAGIGTAFEPEISPLAHESGDALALIMDTHPRPDIPEILHDLHDYERLVRAGRGDSEEAERIKARLDKEGFEFSESDRALFEFLSRKSAAVGG